MAQRVYDEAELMQDHAFARLHVVDGRRMHGGFLDDGRYQPPRALVREQALAHWTDALRKRGGELLDANSSLLSGPRVPNVEQQRLLLQHGLGQTFWNGLTTTGKIEGRGRMLAEMQFPDLQPVIVEDISQMAIGHLSRGLLKAHGLDEGGLPAQGIGGHDVMWFVARDLVFGPNAFPDVEPPESISRPEAGRRWMPELPMPYEGMVSFLMNLLLIEFRAEIGFASTQAVMRTPGLFDASAATEAAEIIGRIRIDEEIHVSSLCLYLGELRSVTFRTEQGGAIPGYVLIDRFWKGLVQWATVEQPQIAARQQLDLIRPRVLAHADGERIWQEFLALGDTNLLLAAG
jgi:hypothetical protein